jgi:hypothetical protein
MLFFVYDLNDKDVTRLASDVPKALWECVKFSKKI